MGNEQIEFMEEISKAPIIVQIFMVTICAIFVVMLLSKKINDVLQWLLVASGLALIQNAGYLLLLQSKNLSEASVALKAEYIGAAYVSTVSLLFVLAYCNKKLPKVLLWGLLGIDTSMLLCVWLWEYTTLYYTSVEYRIIGGTVKLVLGRGILYYIGVCKIVLELLFGMFISIKEMLNARTKIMKTKYVLLISALFFPNLAYLGLLFGILKAYDTVPASTAVTCGVLFLGVVYLHVFEDIYVAYADIVRQMKEPVVIMNKEYRFIGANDGAKALVPQICKLEHGDSIIEEHIIDDDLARKLVHQEECEVELNGRVFDVSVNDVVIDGKLRGYYLLLVDLTKERQQTLKMQELKEEADKANQAKTAFLSNMSHELRTPINAIMGMNEMVMRNTETSEIQEYSQNIQFASKTLLSIVNDILDLSKIEFGKIELTAGEYKVKQLLDDCYMMVSSRAGDKGLEMIVKNNEKLPSVLQGDELRIRQIIINLLTNAIKYTQKGSVTLQFDGHVIGDEMVQLEVSVKDTGIGIKEENIGQLFDAFQRMDLQKNKAIEGTGLGLAITKQFVEIMGGTISVQSTYGAGSCFTVKLPQKIIDSRPMGDFYNGDKGGQNKKKELSKTV
jgi:signal transduction histidine kinase